MGMDDDVRRASHEKVLDLNGMPRRLSLSSGHAEDLSLSSGYGEIFEAHSDGQTLENLGLVGACRLLHAVLSLLPLLARGLGLRTLTSLHVQIHEQQYKGGR